MLMPYHDRTTGEFVQIDCGRKAEALVRQIRAERAVASIPVAASDPR
jgi:hypothetical protein